MKALFQLGLLVPLILLLCAPVHAQADLYAQADAAYQAQDYAAALETYLQIAERYPSCPLTTLRLAKIYAATECWPEAVAAYGKLEQLGPMDPETRIAFGDVLKSAGRLADAIEQYNMAVEPSGVADSSPASVEPEAEAGFFAPFPAQETEAVPATSAQVTAVDTPVPSAVLKTSAPASIAPSIESGPSINRVTPVNTVEPIQPGVFMQSRDDAPDPADDTAPKTPEEILVQARRLFELQQYDRAILEYEAYAQMTGGMDRDVQLEYGDALREADRSDEAEEVFNKLLHADAGDIDAKVGLAKTLGKDGQLEDAMYLLDQLYQSEEALLKAYLARAYCYLVNGYVQEAWSDYGEATVIDPNDPDVLAMEQELRKHEAELSMILPDDPALRADALFGQGEYGKSRGLYEQVVRNDPTNTRAWLRLATIYRWDGDYGDSIEAFETYLKANDEDYEAQLRYAQVLYFADQLKDAEDVLEALISDTDTPIEIYEEALATYGAVLNALGRSKEAAEMYRQALVYNPHNVSARSQYAGVLAANGDLNEAIVQYEAALREDPGSGEVKLGLARTYSWQGDQGKARKYYNQVGMSDPYYGSSRIGLAYSHLASGDRSQALAMAAEAERYDPNNPELATLRAQLSNVGDPSIATTWLQSHDNDDNDARRITTRLDIPLDARGTSVSVEYEELFLDNTLLDEEAAGTYTRASLTIPMSGQQAYLNLRGGFLDIDNRGNPDTSEWTHGVSYTAKLSDRFTFNTGYSDYTFYETTHLARSNVNVLEYTVGGQYKVSSNTTLIGDYSWADLSDGNNRNRLSLNWQIGRMYPQRGRLFYGVAYRYLNYSQDLNNGYWDPSNYHYGEVYADWFDMSNRTLRFDGGLGYGFDHADGTGSSGGFRYYAGLRAYPFGDKYVFKAGYRSSESSEVPQSGSGYRSAEWYLTGVASF